MHQGLVSEFKGHRIPPRPCKSILPNTQEFIEQRRTEMQTYLNLVTEDCILRNSAEFRVFTQSSGEELSKQKALPLDREKACFEDKLDSLIASVSSLIHRKSCFYDKNLQEIKESLKKIQPTAQTFSAAFAHWAACTSGSITMGQFLQNSLFVQGDKGPSQRFSTSIQDFTLKIQQYSLRYESLKQAFTTYKSSVKRYSGLESLIERQVAKHRASQSSECLSRVQDTQEKMCELSTEITVISANIVKESECLASSQETRLSDTIESLVSSVKSHYEAESAFWSSFPIKYE